MPALSIGAETSVSSIRVARMAGRMWRLPPAAPAIKAMRRLMREAEAATLPALLFSRWRGRFQAAELARHRRQHRRRGRPEGAIRGFALSIPPRETAWEERRQEAVELLFLVRLPRRRVRRGKRGSTYSQKPRSETFRPGI